MHKCGSRVRKSVKRERGWRDAKTSFWPLRERERESFIVGKRKGLWSILIGVSWHGETVGRLTRSVAFFIIG